MKQATLARIALASLMISVGVVGCKKGAKSVTPIPNLGSMIRATNENPFPMVVTSNKPPTRATGVNEGGRLTGSNDVNVTPTTPTTATDLTGGGISQGERPDGDMLRDTDTFRDQTVLFEYDRSTIRTGERTKLEAVATYLKNEPANKVEVEGHCDERGTEEYNRSLSERRALAVREHLVNLGISPDRISTAPFGEDRPADNGHDESAWSKNRRAELVLLKPRR